MILRFHFILLVFLTCYWTKSEDELTIDDIAILTKQYSEYVTDVITQIPKAVAYSMIEDATFLSQVSRDVALELTSLSKLYVDFVVDITSQMTQAVGHAMVKAAMDLGMLFGDIERELIRLSRLYVDHVVDITNQSTKAIGHTVIKAATDLSEMFGEITREFISLYRVYMDKATFASTHIGQSAENIIHGLISYVIFYANQMTTVIDTVTTNITDMSRLCIAKIVLTTYKLGQRVETALCWLTDHVTQIDAECVASVLGSVVICLVLELLTFFLITAAIEGAICVFSLPLLFSVIYHQRQRKPKKEKRLASGVIVPWQSPLITLLPSIRVKVILPPLTIKVIVPISILVAMIRQKEVTKGQQSSRLLALTYKAPDPVVDVPTESPMVLEKTPDYTVYKQVPSRCRRGVLNIARKGPVTVRRPKNFVR